MFAMRKLLAVEDEVQLIGQNIVKCPLTAGEAEERFCYRAVGSMGIGTGNIKTSGSARIV